MRRECHKCEGSGTQRGPLGRAFKQTCDVCNGVGYVELDNVVHASIVTKLDLEADQLLREAIGELDDVVIIGYTKDGEEYYASSVADGANALWLLQRSIHGLMDVVDREIDE